MVPVTSNISKAPAIYSPNAQSSASNANVAAAISFRSSSTASILLSTSILPDNRSTKPLTAQQQKANDVINTLTQAKKSLISDRKAAALQKLELARRKLELLRSLGADPKMIAAQAKEIAQEIGEAAQEYSAALQSEGGSIDASALASAGQPADASASDTSGAPTAGADAGAVQ
jgi:hypothetical protein